MTTEYTNRYNDKYTFTPDKDGNLLWEGDFTWCRYIGNPGEPIYAVDPSGGPFISNDTDMGFYHEDFKGKKVVDFERIDTGYKLILL